MVKKKKYHCIPEHVIRNILKKKLAIDLSLQKLNAFKFKELSD